MMTPLLLLSCVSALSRSLQPLQRRKRQRCGCAAVGAVFERQAAAMQLRDRRAERQTEPKAPGLGGEEGLEDSLPVVGRQARAAVGNDDLDGLSVRHPGSDLDDTASRYHLVHGVSGI